MKIQFRILISLVFALAVMIPLLINQPDKIAGFLIFTVVTAIAIFTITSLFNVKNKTMKIVFFTVISIGFFYKLYTNYYVMQWVFTKSIITSLVFVAVLAFVFRAISMITEKKA